MTLNLISRLLQRTQQLPPPLTRDLTVARGLRVPMRDGVELTADHWFPRAGAAGLPTVLIRTTYGSHSSATYPIVRPIAERGFQVLITNSRGTFGSGGAFDPFRNERDDGFDTLDWVIGQPWFGDSIVLYGPSYLGYTQWAVADQVPPQVKAMIPIQSEAAVMLEFLRPDGFALEILFIWSFVVDGQESPLALLRHPALGGRRKMRRLMASLPLEQADLRGAGHRIDYLQNILAHDAGSPHWAPADHSARVADVTIPVSSIAGWHDFFLPGQLRDFTALQAAGRPARLTVGPWAHSMSAGPIRLGMEELLDFGLAHARAEQPTDRAPVRLFVQGADEWRDFQSWPPEGYPQQRLHLQPGGGLATASPADSPPDNYRYDPADPTPAVGGSRFNVNTGSVDNTALEARADVLTFTTLPLDREVEVIGEVDAEIWFRSSLPYADVFVRVCDVNTGDRSYNVTDGLTSLTEADQDTRARVRLPATAYRFRKGHRIRVQISSGAFPRYNRNPGTGEPRGSGQLSTPPVRPFTTTRPARQR
ncbi:X-Pro dipeptidyl-peptidase domain protein [Parafrankia sp. EAN1pec]|nr:X-Pro dipeptidyl-peptidase domain protein [Frankia sp. EAN1pec]